MPTAKPTRIESQQRRLLVGIRLLHTATWAFFVACILAVPVAAWIHAFRLTAALSAFVWCECGVLALNRGRCPLTDIATRYTANREPNFDIYLPALVAQWNKEIFGLVFALNEVFALLVWLRRR